ncbi:MAG: 16S rRNA (uracil(1498)-N(3))-methyltransferase [Carnobacterium sp.]|uniref:16S rRNA (uracil(1498)-N(3))-methyltransferase n=1 Tax=Carnobacterium sp. TaxID=48221 RepID=UPI002FCB8155
MQRYFLAETIADYQTAELILTGEQYHHMIRVMRMKIGDEAYLVFPNQQAFIAEINAIENESVVMHWIADETAEKELPVHVTIASGLPKGDKLDYVIQKGTELGAAGFVPFQATYSITKWDTKKAAKKIDRLKKIAQEAAEQAHRTKIPSVESVYSFKELLEKSPQFDYCLVAYEESAKAGEDQNFAKTLKSIRPGSSLLIVFGPEGGLSPTEIEALLAVGMVPCALGPRILRTETAPLYALAAISYHFELNEPIEPFC